MQKPHPETHRSYWAYVRNGDPLRLDIDHAVSVEVFDRTQNAVPWVIVFRTTVDYCSSSGLPGRLTVVENHVSICVFSIKDTVDDYCLFCQVDTAIGGIVVSFLVQGTVAVQIFVKRERETGTRASIHKTMVLRTIILRKNNITDVVLSVRRPVALVRRRAIR